MKKLTDYQNRQYYICFPVDDDFDDICGECEENIVKPNLRINNGTLNFNGLLYGSDILLICKDNDKIVGYNSVVIKKNSLYINQIAVLPNYKKQGIGKKMMECVIDISNKVGLPLCAHVRSYNEASLAMVKSLGFEKNEEFSNEKNYFFELNTKINENKHHK